MIKSQLDSLISTNSLIKGETYEVTDCNISLFGGTTIIVKAIETNKIESFGTGIFYNPNISYEPILYDYENDLIISTIDLLGNTIEFNELDTEWFAENYGISQSAIAYFKKGNASLFSGVWNNTVKNSIVDTINFEGQLFCNNEFQKNTGFLNNSFSIQSNFNDNLLGIKTIFVDNSFGLNSSFTNNNLDSSVNFSNNVFRDYSSLNNIDFKKASNFYENTVGTNCTIAFVSFGVRSIVSNCIFPNDKTITNLTIEDNVKLQNIDFTNATLIFDGTLTKTIFQLPNGTLKMRYYDNSGTLIIANIND